MRKEPRRVANTLRVKRPKHLEGSRFVAWRLNGLLAGGSGNVSRYGISMGWFYPPHAIDAMEHCVGSFPGAACYQAIELPSYKAAPFQARVPDEGSDGNTDERQVPSTVHRPSVLRVVAITRTVTNTESWGATTTDNRRRCIVRDARLWRSEPKSAI